MILMVLCNLNFSTTQFILLFSVPMYFGACLLFFACNELYSFVKDRILLSAV